MQTKRSEQPTCFDLAVQQRGVSNPVLDTIAREVGFTEAEARVAATYSHGGRPAARVGVLLRVMILQHLYGLSDPQAEAQINDRLSFQKFLQLDTHEAVPDETTIGRFRQRHIACGLHEHLLALLNTQLEARGYMVKRTTLVDATLVASSRQRPAAEAAANGTAPDAAASYTRKGGHTFLRLQSARRQRRRTPTHPRRRPHHGQDLRRRSAAADHRRRHAGGECGQGV